MLPLAKPFFYIGKHQQLATATNAGQIEYQPTIESCTPYKACLNANQCSDGYEGVNCGNCADGYFGAPRKPFKIL